jgi:hypothetical protein
MGAADVKGEPFFLYRTAEPAIIMLRFQHDTIVAPFMEQPGKRKS